MRCALPQTRQENKQNEKVKSKNKGDVLYNRLNADFAQAHKTIDARF
jgi:hypothetical protein